jgi:hypothetical protein
MASRAGTAVPVLPKDALAAEGGIRATRRGCRKSNRAVTDA